MQFLHISVIVIIIVNSVNKKSESGVHDLIEFSLDYIIFLPLSPL